MKILFIAKGDVPDYQSDTVFHGGRSILGADFVDANKLWYMYATDYKEQWSTRIPSAGKEFGRGFTLSGTLPDLKVDRTDIEHKIETKFYDYIIYGSVTRCFDYLPLVSKYYPTNRVIFIDGEDDQNIRTGLLDTGLMFKRELLANDPDLHPIGFGVPKQKVVSSVPTKVKDWATVIPGQLDTYIFDKEEDYHHDYRESMFAITHKKGGWDCLRHYEILMNGCMPYFSDIDLCPDMTMAHFPKDAVSDVKRRIDSGVIHTHWYEQMGEDLLEFTREQLTTEAVFNRVINTAKQCAT